MHVHGTHLDPNALNLYSAVEKSAAAKRAAEVRKQLMSSTGEIEDELDTAIILQIDKEAEQGSRQPPEDPAKKKEADKDSKPTDPKNDATEDSGEEELTDDPMSLWG